jgi:hypothetical protein
MTENISKKPIINGLLYVGGLLSLNFLLKIPDNTFLNILATCISIANLVLMYRFAISYREDNFGGFISYGKSFKFLFQIYFFGNIILSFIIFIYAAFINKDFSEILASQVLKMYEQFKIPVDDQVYSLVTSFYKPAPMALINLISGLFGAAFWAAVISFFVKKEKSIFDQPQ